MLELYKARLMLDCFLTLIFPWLFSLYLNVQSTKVWLFRLTFANDIAN